MDDTQIDWDDNDDFDDEYAPPDDDDEEMVFECGVDGCLMPGEHFRSECHTVADVLRQERCGKHCPDGDWNGDKEPGGMECGDCGCIFISDEGRPRCKVCHDARSSVTR